MGGEIDLRLEGPEAARLARVRPVGQSGLDWAGEFTLGPDWAAFRGRAADNRAHAKGVVFLTLEDETGIANIVVWKDVFERFRLLELIEKKKAERGVTKPRSGTAPREAEVINLMDALRRSLAGGGAVPAKPKTRAAAERTAPAPTLRTAEPGRRAARERAVRSKAAERP